MTSPLLSVCLVTYNQESFIRKVLDGAVSQQTNFLYEIVIGEDCSTDSTRAICKEYEDKFPEIVRLLPQGTENLGLNLNMLRTYRQCKGKYIAYLEGDDYWIATDKLQKQVDILESQSDVVLVHTNCKLWNVESGNIQEGLIRFEGECIREKQAGISGVIAEYEGNFRRMKTSTCVYRKAVFDEILAEDEFAYSNREFPTQDFQLFQDMANRGKFAFIDEDTTVIALAETISVSNNPAKQFNFRAGFDKIGTYYMQKYNLPHAATQVWQQREMHWFLNFAMRYPEFGPRAMERMNVAVQNGYVVPVTQKILSFVIKHPFVRMVASPIFKLYSRRG